MDVQTITMPKDEATELFRRYRGSVKERMTAEDHAIMRGYQALSKGSAIIDLVDVFRRTGLDHLARPRLAIVRADAEHVYFTGGENGSGRFAMKTYHALNDRATRQFVRVPSGTFPEEIKKWRGWDAELKASVPQVPPFLKPAHALSNYHILWEETNWTVEPPSDPILCRRLAGMLFAVVAQWDLTDLERAVMRGRFSA